MAAGRRISGSGFFTMRDARPSFTGGPQFAHKLLRNWSTDPVDKLFISGLLLTCNDLSRAWVRLYAPPFLPTMKFQLLQLPLLVGSGRVSCGRALFSCLRPSVREPFQVLKRSR